MKNTESTRGFVVRGIAEIGYSSKTTERVTLRIPYARSEHQARGIARDTLQRRNPGTRVYFEIESVNPISPARNEMVVEPRRTFTRPRQLTLFGRQAEK